MNVRDQRRARSYGRKYKSSYRSSRPHSSYRVGYAPWLIAPAAVAMLFLLIPIVAVLWRTPWVDFFRLISTPEALDALWLSLHTCLLSVAVGFVVGVPFAVVLAKSTHAWWARLLRILVLLPMVLPPVVAGLALLLAWGRTGLIGQHLNVFGITIGFSTIAVVFAQTFVSMPFLITSLEGAIRAQGNAYDETARALGASRTRTFFTVSLPIMAPAVLSAVALSFSRSLGEFGATITFAGSLQGVTRTMPLQIYLQRETDTDQALALAVILIVLAIAMLVLANVATTRGNWAAHAALTEKAAASKENEAAVLKESGEDTEGALSSSMGDQCAGTDSAPVKPAVAAREEYDARASETHLDGQAGKQTANKRAPSISVDAQVQERGVHLVVDIHAGIITAVMGANGAGKSTLLGLIAGTLAASEGGVTFDPAHPTIVLLQQNPLLFPHMSVLKNVEFGLRVKKMNREEARRRALEELAFVGLENLAHRHATQLSGGQAQRVAIARAMAIQPDIVLLDEPFAGLDEEASTRVREELRTRLGKAGVTAVLVTHDVLDAEYLATELLLVRAGRIVERRQLKQNVS